MKLILPIIKNYSKIFQNDTNDYIISQFNEKEKTLFNSVLEDTIKTNHKAASVLYNGGSSKPAFVKMKGVFIDKLMYIITNVQFPIADLSMRRRYVDIFRNYFAIRILLFFSIRKAAIHLAKKNYRHSVRYHMTYISMDLARLLSFHYLTFVKDDKIGSDYYEQFQTWLRKYENESYAEHLYSMLMLQLKKKHVNVEVINKAKQYQKQLESKMEYVSVRFMVLYFLIRQLQYALTSNHKENIAICQKAIDYLQENSPEDANAIQIFLNFQIGSFIELGKYEEAADKLAASSDDDISGRWMSKQETRVRLLFFTEKYEEVNQIIENVMNVPLFKVANDSTKIRWWLYKFYFELFLLLSQGKDINIRRIRLNLTRLKSDKKAGNIPLLIGNTIYDIIKHDIDYIIDKEKSIKNYVREHLSDGTNERSKAFMQLLLSLPDRNFEQTKFKTNEKDALQSMAKNPIRMKNTVTADIIPYEKLWDLLKEAIDKHITVA